MDCVTIGQYIQPTKRHLKVMTNCNMDQQCIKMNTPKYLLKNVKLQISIFHLLTLQQRLKIHVRTTYLHFVSLFIQFDMKHVTLFEPIGEVGAIFSLQLSSRTQITKIKDNKK